MIDNLITTKRKSYLAEKLTNMILKNTNTYLKKTKKEKTKKTILTKH